MVALEWNSPCPSQSKLQQLTTLLTQKGRFPRVWLRGTAAEALVTRLYTSGKYERSDNGLYTLKLDRKQINKNYRCSDKRQYTFYFQRSLPVCQTLRTTPRRTNFAGNCISPKNWATGNSSTILARLLNITIGHLPDIFAGRSFSWIIDGNDL